VARLSDRRSTQGRVRTIPPVRAPSGEQFELAHGDLRAVVTEVGATLRSLRAGDQDLIWGFGQDEMCSGGRGQVLAPWPNRLDDGRYRFAGHEGHAALDEPPRRCAIHGIVRWLPWAVEERAADAVRLATTLLPSPAYPFHLRLELTYRLGGDGLLVDCMALNAGDDPLPFGIGFHPYLEPGPAGVDAARLSVPASSRIPLDGRGMPMGARALVAPGDQVAVAVERRSGASGDQPPIGAAVLDECLTGMRAGEDGRWRARLQPARRPDGATPAAIEIWAEEPFRYCEVFTADTLPGAGLRRAVAVEPMTCPPNALRSGTDLLVLDPGQRFAGSFGIRRLDETGRSQRP
jgi:aldose 1-epimerase